MRALVCALAAFVPLGLAASCSLDLDESKIGARGDAAPLAVDSGSTTGDAAVDAGGGECTSDDGCRSGNTCLSGTCDVARRRCVYEVCAQPACKAAVCDPAAKTCGAAADYKLRATEIALRAPAVGGARGLAFVHPWLFVTTSAGLVVLDVSNPANTKPREVPVVGLGFVPAQVVASGSRVWLRAGVAGPGPSKLPLAYVDPPGDPFAERLVAHTALADYDRPAAEGVVLYPRANDGLLLVGGPDGKCAASVVDAPLGDPLALKSTPLVPAEAPETNAHATSGSRVLVGSLTAGVQAFSLVGGAGTPAPSAGPVVSIPGVTSASQRAGQSGDGAIFWAAGVHTGPVPAVTSSVRGFFLVGGEAQGLVAEAAVVVGALEGGVDANEAVVGPITMTDAKTAVVAVRPRNRPAETVIQVVTREPLEAPAAKQVEVPNVPIANMQGATQGRGIAWFSGNIPGPPQSGVVIAVAPGCPP